MSFITDSNTKDTAIVGGTGLAVGMLGLGAYVGSKIPGLRGGKGKILGAAVATKRLFLDIPKNLLSGGKKGKSAYDSILNAKTYELKLDPRKLKQYSYERARIKTPNFDKLSPMEQFEKAKEHDMSSTVRIMKEEEDKARKVGAKYIAGASHFSPELAARHGYIEAPEVLDSTNKKLWGKLYYNSARKSTLKKLNTQGAKSLDELDAYWLTVDPAQIKLFKKDLSMSAAEINNATTNSLKTKTPEHLIDSAKAEAAFKKNYDNLLRTIIKEKSIV